MEYDAWQIYDEEDLKEKTAYVFRNPTVARMGFTPKGYRWSSARLVFSDEGAAQETGRRIGLMSSYETRKVFETRVELPEDWILLPEGLIWPGNYTDIRRIEKLFNTKELASLDLPKRIHLCKEVKKKTGATLKQMARILHMPYNDLKKIFG